MLALFSSDGGRADWAKNKFLRPLFFFCFGVVVGGALYQREIVVVVAADVGRKWKRGEGRGAAQGGTL